MKPVLKVAGDGGGAEAVVRITGRLVGAGDAPIVIARIHRLLDRGARRIVLDLSGARLIDCSGLGLVLACRRTVERHGARLRVLGARAAIRRMFEMSRLAGLLDGPGDARSRADIPLALSA